MGNDWFFSDLAIGLDVSFCVGWDSACRGRAAWRWREQASQAVRWSQVARRTQVPL